VYTASKDAKTLEVADCQGDREVSKGIGVDLVQLLEDRCIEQSFRRVRNTSELTSRQELRSGKDYRAPDYSISVGGTP